MTSMIPCGHQLIISGGVVGTCCLGKGHISPHEDAAWGQSLPNGHCWPLADSVLCNSSFYHIGREHDHVGHACSLKQGHDGSHEDQRGCGSEPKFSWFDLATHPARPMNTIAIKLCRECKAQPGVLHLEGCTLDVHEQRRQTVDHPPHYNTHPSGIECVVIAEHMGFNIGNALKYLWRAGLKDGSPTEEDYRKAIWYINREIAKISKEKA